MTLVLKIDGVTVVGRVKMGDLQGLPTAAWYCDPMTGGVIIEDRDGELDLKGWHYFSADEDDCVVGGTRLFTGWLTGITAKRGNEKDRKARVWDCSVVELNGLFGLEAFRGGDAKRPAETDVARITWMMGTDAMDDTPVADLGRFSTAGPINLSETDYVTSFPMELAVPTAGIAGKNVYAYWSDDDEAVGLHFDLTANGPTAAVAVSNDMADVDDIDTFYPLLDGELERDPSEEATGILLHYRNGYAYGQNTALIAELSPTEVSPLAFKRDQVIQSDRIGAEATAQAYVTRFLAQRDRDKETLRFTVRLPATKVNAIHAGDILSVKFTHLPNLDPAANRVVTRRTVFQSPGRRDFYDLVLECADYEIVAPGGGDPGDLPFTPATCDVADVTIVQQAHSTTTLAIIGELSGASWPSPPTPGNLLVCLWAMAGRSLSGPTAYLGTMPGWDQCGPGADMAGIGGSAGTVLAFTKMAEASEPTLVETIGGSIGFPASDFGNCYIFEVAGVDSFDVEVEGVQTGAIANHIGVSLTPTAGRVAAVFSVFVVNQAVGFAFPITPDAGMTELYEEVGLGDSGNPGRWVAWRTIDGTTGSYAVGGTEAIPGATFDWAHLAISLVCTASDQPPPTGTQVTHEVVGEGDGATTVFSTNFPYADGSLRVWVDGVPIINGLTESDPATGEFTLDFAPHGDLGDVRAEIITASYQGR